VEIGKKTNIISFSQIKQDKFITKVPFRQNSCFLLNPSELSKTDSIMLNISREEDESNNLFNSSIKETTAYFDIYVINSINFNDSLN